MVTLNESFTLETKGVLLKASLVPWDTKIFGYPVAQIECMKIFKPQLLEDFVAFEAWRDINQVKMMSCRLSHEQLNESMFLETKGFRFIEMVLYPRINELLQLRTADQGLTVLPADENDLPAIRKIAETAFTNERFHVDPRLDPHLGDLRYGQWVATTFMNQKQKIVKILDNKTLVAFFTIEAEDDGSVYWHLTAVSPEHQGKGYGRRTWLAMLNYHRKNGQVAISTTISARNTRILNLYSSLNFRFSPPGMTFHWLSE